MSRPIPVALILLVPALACAPGGAGQASGRQVLVADLESQRQSLEQEVRRSPRSAQLHIELGEVYYRIAREALDRDRDEARYLANLERASDEFVSALELEPDNQQPHFYMGVMDVYRGDLPRALRSFGNARRLQPSGIAYTNIGEVFVYTGELEKARNWTRVGYAKGAGAGAVEFNEMLISWRAGDLASARRHFERLATDYPDHIRTINVARLPRAPQSFEEFAGYCCGSPACGPYMEAACGGLGIEVSQREISNETILKELRIEMETQRRLRKIYEQRKELEIEVEDPDS